MSDRKFIALGTASQVPTRRRNHNGYFLRWDNEGILFDPGEGTQRQMLFAGVRASEITAICITHFHGDHCLGLPGIIQRLSLDGIEHPVDLYYPQSGRRYLNNLKNASIFYNRTNLREHPLAGNEFVAKRPGFEFSALPLKHSVESWGYRFREPDGRRMLPEKLEAAGIRGPAIGELIRKGSAVLEDKEVKLEDVSVHKPGQIFAFIMDTGVCAAAVELARDADMAVIESTYLNSEEEDARKNGHLTAAQAAEIAREAGVGRLILTHFSQRYDDDRAFVEEARPIHSDVVAVRDRDQVVMPERKS